MSKRVYPRKRDEERRIVVSFSLSGEALSSFREAFSLAEGREPEVAEIRERARDLAFQAIGSYIKHHIEQDAIIL